LEVDVTGGRYHHCVSSRLLGPYQRWTRLGLALFLAAPAIGCSRSAPELAAEDLHRKLVAILASRPVEPRLAGGFSYAACSPRADVSDPLAVVQCERSPAQGAEWLTFLKELRRTPEAETPAYLRVRGLVRLIAGGSDSASSAVDDLERAAAFAPEDAALSNDLAVAYVVRARREQRPQDLVRALDIVARAGKAAPTLAEALFNRALIVESLFLEDQARDAWRLYLDHDPGSAWATEARQRLAALDQRSADPHSAQSAREKAFYELLPSWGAAPGSAPATAALEQARQIGRTLVDAGGDRSVKAAVEAIDDAAGDAERLRFLAHGHLAYRDAYGRQKALAVAEADPLFHEAARLLDRGGSPMAWWARAGVAGDHVLSSGFAAARQEYAEVIRAAEAHGFTALVGISHWGVGLSWVKEARFVQALEPYASALESFRMAGEDQNRSAVLDLLSEAYGLLGRTDEEWRYRYLAIGPLSRYPASRRLYGLLWGAGESTLYGNGYSNAALFFLDEAIRVAERSGSPPMLVDGLTRRSAARYRCGDLAAARQDLDRARRELAAVNGDDIRAKLSAHLDVAETDLLRSEDPRRAVSMLERSVGFYRAERLPLREVDALRRAGLADLALGDTAQAEERLTAAIDLLETQRTEIGQVGLRISHADATHRVYDAMIQLLFESGRGEEALLFGERSRQVIASRSDDVWTAGLEKRLPADVLVLEYVLSRDRLFTWRIHQGGVEAHAQTVDANELVRQVSAFVAGLVRPSPSADAEIPARLHDLLLPEDLESRFAGYRLVFVGDGVLHGLPFAALRHPQSNRFLVEGHILSIAPSAALYLHGLERVGTLGHRALEGGAVLFADPAFDSRTISWLRPLQHAEEETAAIAALYPRSETVAGADATRERFLELIATRPILHYSGHAVIHPRDPDLSYLALAAEEGSTDGGILYPRDLEGRDLTDLRLVVLAACSTVAPAESRVGGLAGLARPFLVGGVPAVIGTLWDLDDLAARELFPAFHRELLATGDAAAALRAAQLEQLATGDSTDWAGIQLVGSI
jgi:CHAT domain-containing protein